MKFRLDKTRAVNSFKNEVFEILRKILCSLVFFLTSVSFIRYNYKVTVMVLICFVFSSWITDEFSKFPH